MPALNLSVTAEGIDTAEQRNQRVVLGCDRTQGYHFARPLPGDAVDRLLVKARLLPHVA